MLRCFLFALLLTPTCGIGGKDGEESEEGGDRKERQVGVVTLVGTDSQEGDQADSATPPTVPQGQLIMTLVTGLMATVNQNTEFMSQLRNIYTPPNAPPTPATSESSGSSGVCSPEDQISITPSMPIRRPNASSDGEPRPKQPRQTYELSELSELSALFRVPFTPPTDRPTDQPTANVDTPSTSTNAPPNQQPPPSTATGQFQYRGNCYNCGMVGHIRRDCPSFQASFRGRGRGCGGRGRGRGGPYTTQTVCQLCRQKGHVLGGCPFRNNLGGGGGAAGMSGTFGGLGSGGFNPGFMGLWRPGF